MAYRVYTQIKEVDVVADFVITGGIAKNSGIVRRLEKLLGMNSLKTAVDYQLAGAIGAALFGKVLYEKPPKK
jgi:activator of 2-hydroxyglutaryl-CoA dehydratase